MATDQRKGMTRGRARRGLKLGELASSLGSSYIVEALKWPFRSADKRREQLLDTHVRNAMKIIERSEELRGAFTKLVQMLSMRDDILPAQALEILSAAQSRVPPMPYPTIREQVRNELGRPPEEMFASFDETAFAAASLGQVHAARLHDGREVVVKVQYPGVEETVEQDLENIKALLRVFSFVGRDVMRQKIDVSEVAQELDERLHEELDYLNEAKNIALFQRMFCDDPDILIPEVHGAYTSRRVITMSRLEGYSFTEILNPGVDQSLKDWIALKYFRTLWRQILEFGVLHTDPHPGNYFVTYHPKLGILDFGSVRVFPEPIRQAYLGLMRSVVGRDKDKTVDCLVRLGFIDAETDATPVLDIIELMWEPLIVDREYSRKDFNAIERAMESARIGLEARLFKRPGHSVFLGRALLGLDAYLLQFGTTANWHRELTACVEEAERAKESERFTP